MGVAGRLSGTVSPFRVEGVRGLPGAPQDEDGLTRKFERSHVGGLGSPIFPSGCEGKLGVALESLQGLRDLT